MAEFLNFLARIATLQPFLFPLEWCHGLITWPCLNIMNCKFQTVLLFFFLSLSSCNKPIILSVFVGQKKPVVWWHFPIQRAHKNLEIGIYFLLCPYGDFFLLPISNTAFGKQWIQFSDIMIVKTPASIFVLSDFSEPVFHISTMRTLSCLPCCITVIIHYKNE